MQSNFNQFTKEAWESNAEVRDSSGARHEDAIEITINIFI